MSLVRRLSIYLRERRGASAAEFALVLPGFVFLTLGAINFSILMYAVESLHQAAEGAARYASIATANGVSSSTLGGSSSTPNSVANYAAQVYRGPGLTSMSFSWSLSGSSKCGNFVHATGQYNLFGGYVQVPVTVNANACFP